MTNQVDIVWDAWYSSDINIQTQHVFQKYLDDLDIEYELINKDVNDYYCNQNPLLGFRVAEQDINLIRLTCSFKIKEYSSNLFLFRGFAL